MFLSTFGVYFSIAFQRRQIKKKYDIHTGYLLLQDLPKHDK